MNSTIMDMFAGVTADGSLAVEAKKQDNEQNLIPAGKYPFTVTDVREAEQREAYDDGRTNPLAGHKVARLTVKLSGVSPKGYDALDGKDRTYFFNVCPDKVYGEKGNLVGAAKIAGDMIAVSGTQGQPFSTTIAWFMENRATISIRQFDGRDGSKQNSVAGISRLA